MRPVSFIQVTRTYIFSFRLVVIHQTRQPDLNPRLGGIFQSIQSLQLS